MGSLYTRGFQTLGLAGLGMGGGFERLHYLVSDAFDSGGHLSPAFLKVPHPSPSALNRLLNRSSVKNPQGGPAGKLIVMMLQTARHSGLRAALAAEQMPVMLLSAC